MQDEDQSINLPDLRDEWEEQRNASPYDIQCHEKRLAGEPGREGPHDWSDRDIGHHLDRKRDAEHLPGLVSCKLESEQAERDRE